MEPKFFLNPVLVFCSPTFTSKLATHFPGPSLSIHAIVIWLGIHSEVSVFRCFSLSLKALEADIVKQLLIGSVASRSTISA